MKEMCKFCESFIWLVKGEEQMLCVKFASEKTKTKTNPSFIRKIKIIQHCWNTENGSNWQKLQRSTVLIIDYQAMFQDLLLSANKCVACFAETGDMQVSFLKDKLRLLTALDAPPIMSIHIFNF